MTARRASAKPDGDATHLPAWQQAYASLSQLTKTAAISDKIILNANKVMQQFETEYMLPDQTAGGLKPTRNRLRSDLSDIKDSSQKEIDICKTALDQIGTIIKLREAPDNVGAPSVAEKRPKRQREASASSLAAQSASSAKAPTNGAGAGAASATNGGLTVVLPRKSAAFQQIQARIQKQLPLKPGRKVAFRVPGDDGKTLASPPIVDGSSYEEAGWILATIRSVEKDGKYMVQDVEGENGQEPPIYPASLSSIIPLPIASVLSNDPSHLNAYPEYYKGTIVLALYPETTSFYRAEVVASPKEMVVAGQRTAPVATRAVPSYRLRFDEDEDRVRLISAEEVIEFPGY
ncbi:hypothetical protein M408DRAFT_15669 [Serendipita vermifera MAFF 305830]|uniref:SGF29 C-terminal domain-containing protein n=1 Tax=Serendipita vermifera MAFF 305830 TaxID=933852 RepID=A0A0C2XM00_SERVB|nr:hypothetical protein M408DRAFT_15669 [Serendipita vermifera MAFF 305830]